MASSSLVGTTSTATRESAVDSMRGSFDLAALSSWLIFTPKDSSRPMTSARRSASFSPTPAVKVMASKPPMVAA